MRTEDIHPVSEHRTHLTEHLKQVQETGRPMVITQKGRAAGVLLSPASYDELVSQAEYARDLQSIREGLKQAASNEGVDAREALRDIAAKFNITINR